MIDCTFILLGATGDLTKRKLIPALYKLVQDKKIKNFLIVGAALDEITADEFIDRGRSFISAIDEELWKTLKNSSYYQKLDFNDPQGFKTLCKFVESLEKEHQLSGNRLAYLAVPSLLFCEITINLGKSGLIKKDTKNSTWHRIVYEKPFGTSLRSAQKINRCITDYFDEKQIYRIDHYLTKELVGSILLVRFTNMVFEPLWNNKYIEEVHIVLTETLGIEGRGRYYDHYGVLKDMVQNHIMQLIALIGMELPQKLDAHSIRDQKAQTLQKVRCTDGLLGQYDGYTSEKDIPKDSKTPTFAQLRMLIETPRWQGVPFYIKTGKALERKNSSIHIKFREVPCMLREQCVYTSNYLTIQIDPDASFSLQLNTKKPGTMYEVTPVNLNFNHNYVFGTTTPEAYEMLLEQVMMGEQAVSIRFDEIEYSWMVLEHVEHMNLPLYHYQQGTSGPSQVSEFAKKFNIAWRI